MELLKQRILQDGKVKEGGVLKVDSFLNHRMDISLLQEIGREFRRRFPQPEINKILTIEASGIGIAAITAQYFNNADVVFAKKTKSKNLDGELYTVPVRSYTRGELFEVQWKLSASPAQNWRAAALSLKRASKTAGSICGSRA